MTCNKGHRWDSNPQRRDHMVFTSHLTRHRPDHTHIHFKRRDIQVPRAVISSRFYSYQSAPLVLGCQRRRISDASFPEYNPPPADSTAKPRGTIGSQWAAELGSLPSPDNCLVKPFSESTSPDTPDEHGLNAKNNNDD